MSHRLKRGIVVRVLPDGFGFLEEEKTRRQYVFSLRAIPQYRGQSIKELNLHTGVAVEFEADGDQVAVMELRSH
jgi:hypothetical protein